MRKLEGKIALITGASRGIGRSVALAFAREGARLFLVGHVDQHALEDTSRLAREAGADVQAGLFDVGNYDDVCRIADRIAAHFGTLDIVVNNAGTIRPTPLPEITPEQWDARYAPTCMARSIARVRWRGGSWHPSVLARLS